MMLLLIIDVPDHTWRFVFSQRQYAITFLPSQSEFRLDFARDSEGNGTLQFADKISHCNGRRQTYQQVNMIWHCVVADWPAAAASHC